MRLAFLILTHSLLLLVASSCDRQTTESAADYDRRQSETKVTESQGDTIASEPKPAADPSNPGGILEGKVEETMNSGGYTYVLLETPQGKTWAAARDFKVEVGDSVRLAGGMPMVNFRSSTLDRTFDSILFVQQVEVAGTQDDSAASTESAALPAGHPPIDPVQDSGAADKKPQTGPVEKLEGGHTIAELFAQKKELAGKKVRIRGRVVKASPNIMGKNWLHIQDGTGEPGKNDLTVTSSELASVGSVIIVEGTMQIDKDIGAGYKFEVLVEGATIKADAQSEAGD